MLQLINLGVAEVDLNVGVEEAEALGGRVAARAVWRLLACRDRRPKERAKGISGYNGMVASRWRLDSCGGMRGAVDALVTPANTKKVGYCGSLAYGPMAKMEAADAGAAGMGCRG
jgi:hypothetical protein